MKRPTPSEPGAELRILEATAAHIRRDGAQRIAIVRIAAGLGMSHANVYRYFPSRQALIDAVTVQWLKPVEASLRLIAEGPDPASDKLERMLLALNRAYRDKLESDESIFALFAAAVDDGRGVARKHRLKVQSEIQRVVDDGQASGMFLLADQRRALALVYDAMHRFIHPVCVRMDRDTTRPVLQARQERVVSLLLRALQTGRV